MYTKGDDLEDEGSDDAPDEIIHLKKLVGFDEEIAEASFVIIADFNFENQITEVEEK